MVNLIYGEAEIHAYKDLSSNFVDGHRTSFDVIAARNLRTSYVFIGVCLLLCHRVLSKSGLLSTYKTM